MSRLLDLCAIDAGQTCVRYLIWDQDCCLLTGQVEQGVTSILTATGRAMLRTVLALLSKDIRTNLRACRFRVVSIGCTGVARERDEYGIVLDEFRAAFPGAKIVLENDMLTAHLACFQGKPGIILHAGTGAFAFGNDDAGHSMRVGGWGYLLGDDGAGFGLGLTAVRAAIRAIEKTGPATSLADVLLPYFGVEQCLQLKTVIYNADFQLSKIADFTKILVVHAEEQDAVANHILECGAEALSALVAPLLQQLQFERPTVALTGALLNAVEIYAQRCQHHLHHSYGLQIDVMQGNDNLLEGVVRLGKLSLTPHPIS